MSTSANDKSFTYTPVRITNPEDIVGAGAAGTVTLGAGTAVVGHVIVDTLPALVASTAAIGKLAANSGVVIGAVELPASATSTLSNVSASATSVTVLASNAARLGAVIVNDSTSVAYIKFGSTASATSFTYYLPGTNASGTPSTLEVPARYTGIITGIWVSGTGTARVTELT